MTVMVTVTSRVQPVLFLSLFSIRSRPGLAPSSFSPSLDPFLFMVSLPRPSHVYFQPRLDSPVQTLSGLPHRLGPPSPSCSGLCLDLDTVSLHVYIDTRAGPQPSARPGYPMLVTLDLLARLPRLVTSPRRPTRTLFGLSRVTRY